MPAPQPQATTVPSLFRARLWYPPAAIAVTPERPLGTLRCPKFLPFPQPQATTVPVVEACAAEGTRSSAAIAAPARARARGEDLRLPMRDRLGSASGRWRDRFLSLDCLEGRAAGRDLAPAAGGARA